MRTPWGEADFIEEVADGVVVVKTPSHGGIRLSPERNADVPEKYRTYAASWSKGWYDGSVDSYGWYEEDCAALAVVVTFPELFPTVDEFDKLEEMLERMVSS